MRGGAAEAGAGAAAAESRSSAGSSGGGRGRGGGGDDDDDDADEGRAEREEGERGGAAIADPRTSQSLWVLGRCGVCRSASTGGAFVVKTEEGDSETNQRGVRLCAVVRGVPVCAREKERRSG
jgi:hypothetical protein